ncbi:hypothetical protein C9374_008993 [Naegleria lovaniensis]|uniref:Uncharacterized protein n=1 Tax=Naegleria lovaniensis TaxID=51637 RepID=A0AA88G5C3_NAELO|nr:uncharacterized protein C9374_013694 [Naegleria lovaniensis]XP_044543625.1 uncharacterized protein C9374_010735 [Naegleria lovaniensis]XP_044545170.1 uncharacterized protein C9374_008993 [Naegleria lovaniensis]KAG2372630.1 hypothetical protein C9374_013694 [Naegleria lovaniensis]KAG2374451.1 hypothetical protein C9374_010735 [Naegleria lovaniensis]KAG2377908.1 hypothetical protein C9374_008993 [Naegleria lovaniensis]
MAKTSNKRVNNKSKSTTKKKQATKNKKQTTNVRDLQWLAYDGSNSSSYRDVYQIMPQANPVGRERIRMAACLAMFAHSAAFFLGHSLDPYYTKRYQRGIKLGCLNPDYFVRYFGNSSARYITKHQVLNFDNHTRRIECIGFAFDNFEDMPGLNCGKTYALRGFVAQNPVRVFDHDINQYVTMHFDFQYRMYFTKLVFYCNTESWMVTVDFDWTIERYNEMNDTWDSV